MNKLILNNQFISFEKCCDGILGIHAIHFETGQVVTYNSDQKFLMCSTYKIPIAIHLFQQIEKSRINLTDYKEVTEFDLRPGISGTLNQFSYSSPVKITIENLLIFMMQESCNTSTDFLLRIMGGPSSVTEFLHKYNINDMRVDRYCLETISQWDGIKKIPDNHQITLTQYKNLEKQVSPEDLVKARKQFKEREEDLTTPSAMTSLINKLFHGELIKKTNAELLLKIMSGCKRGQGRLLGLLPAGTVIAHKTGTLTGYTCDVGIITLPHGAGNFAISVYIKQSTKDLANNERIIAEIGRTIYDYFLLR